MADAYLMVAITCPGCGELFMLRLGRATKIVCCPLCWERMESVPVRHKDERDQQAEDEQVAEMTGHAKD